MLVKGGGNFLVLMSAYRFRVNLIGFIHCQIQNSFVFSVEKSKGRDARGHFSV